MNILYMLMLISSISYLIFTAPDKVMPTMMSGASAAITLAMTLLAIYCVWLSLLKLMETLGITRWLSKLCRPVIKRLFKGEDDRTLEYITVNMSANLLGMGGAATPMGIKAIENMRPHQTNQTTALASSDKQNDNNNKRRYKSKKNSALASSDKLKASDNMILFLVINCTSIQLFPATIIGLRASEGSGNPADIILPSLIATLCSTIIGTILCKLLSKKIGSPLNK